jgi:AbrB family looped-hinge helix DNA binding protein
MVWTVTVSSKGQLVLPKAVRERLGVKTGDKLLFVQRQGRIEIQAYSSNVLQWYGALTVDGPQNWDTIEAEVGRRRAEEVIRESESH